MSTLKTSRLAIASLAVIGGCAGGGSQLTSSTQPVVVRSIDSHGGRHYTFVSDYLARAVDVFGGTRQIGQITGFNEPEGLTTDSSGNLYVANTDGHDVEEFAPPYTGAPIATIPDPDGLPTAVAVTRGGLLAVVNICNGSQYSGCTFRSTAHFYAKDHFTSPCATVPIFRTGLSGAFDDSGNLYVGGLSKVERTQIGVIVGGCSAKAIRELTPQYAINFPSGIQIDTNDNVAILDGSSDQLDIFAAPAKNSRMLSLISTAPLNDTQLADSLALTSDGKRFYISDWANHQTEEYAYPAGGSAIRILRSNPSCDCEGVGVAPAEFP
jgi:DNA-binding beta-propeller fold protein YncE